MWVGSGGGGGTATARELARSSCTLDFLGLTSYTAARSMQTKGPYAINMDMSSQRCVGGGREGGGTATAS